jgi:hypothetical protein
MQTGRFRTGSSSVGFSSTDSPKILLLSHASSCGWIFFRSLAPVSDTGSFYFGTDEAAATLTQVLALQGTFSSRLSGWTTPVLLPQTRLPQGQET